MDVAVAVAVAAGWWWASCRHARPATPSLIEVRAATWGEDRSARVMMVTGAELSDDSVQWQQEVAVVEGGGALKGGDAAAQHGGCRRLTGCGVHMRDVLGQRRAQPRKGGERMLAKI